MITANMEVGPFEAYRIGTILPMMAKHQVRPQGVADGPPLKARVNHGRWVVDCECNGAELAFEEGLFMCLSCYNAGHRHQYRKAVFPKNRQAIELVLMARPIINRNWFPYETLAMLKAENAEHQAELLEVN